MMAHRLYYCGMKGKNLTRHEMGIHNCLRRGKGRNKNKRCMYLVEMTAAKYL